MNAANQHREAFRALLVVTMLLALCSTTAALAAPDFQGHWASKQIEEWIEKGLIQGYPDGSFRPGNTATRAEFMALINRTFGFVDTGTVAFSDAKESDWFLADVSKAVRAGYIEGYPDGTVKPGNPISRQEVVTVVARLLGLAPDAESAIKFADAARMPLWSKGYIGAASREGYVDGYPDGTFKPEARVTRAELVTILHRLAGMVCNAGGTYGSSAQTTVVERNLIVTAPEVTLENILVKKNLIISEGAASGLVILKNVGVSGTTFVNGGSSDSVHVRGSDIGRLRVTKANPRIVIEENSLINVVEVSASARIEVKEDAVTGVKTVVITGELPEGTTLVLCGDFDEVIVESENASIAVERGTVGNLTVREGASGANVTFGDGSRVENLEISDRAEVSGSGTIGKADIRANGVVLEQIPEDLEVDEGITATVGGEEVTGSGAVPGGTIMPPLPPAPTISTIEDVTGSVEIEEAYTLPTQVTAKMSDGSAKQVSVTWTAPAGVSIENGKVTISIPGVYEFKGTVTDYDKDVILKLAVNKSRATGTITWTVVDR